MSKRKMVAQEFNTVELKDDRPVESRVMTDPSSTVADKIEARCSAAAIGLSEEVKAKLEEYEKMSATMAAVSKENDGLKDKIAEYVEELAKLRDEAAKKPAPEQPDGDGDASELKSELKRLRDENDKYLMRISELSFDNARMTSSMQEMEKKLAAAQPATSGAKPVQQYPNVYRGVRTNRNGYSDWN